MKNGAPFPRNTARRSPAHWAGGAAFLAAGLLWVASVPTAAAAPLGAFVLACLAAPFFPQAGFFLPVIHRGAGDRRAVALTFDDGPDPVATPRLLDLLARHAAPATFFVVGRRAEAAPDLVREILARGHTLGNHSYRHDPFLMLRSRERLRAEIVRTQAVLHALGVRPRVFRPPVGITNPRLPAVLGELDLACVTFSCRAGDFGNRRIGGLAHRILGRVRPGAIILLHDGAPPGRDGVQEWLAEVEKVLVGLEAQGYRVLPLAELIGRPVTERRPRSGGDFT